MSGKLIVERLHVRPAPEPGKGFTGIFDFDHEHDAEYTRYFAHALKVMTDAIAEFGGPFPVSCPRGRVELWAVCLTADISVDSVVTTIADMAYGDNHPDYDTTEPTRLRISLEDPGGPMSCVGWWVLNVDAPWAFFTSERYAHCWLQLLQERARA